MVFGQQQSMFFSANYPFRPTYTKNKRMCGVNQKVALGLNRPINQPKNQTINKYIFGYGSFQSFTSITKTVLNIKDDEADIDSLTRILVNGTSLMNESLEYKKKIQVARVKNMKRGWYFNIDRKNNRITKSSTTLGAIRTPDFTTNGTLFPVTEESLENLDKRESGYTRLEISVNDIEIIRGDGIPTNSIIYFYSLDDNKISEPSSECPLIQSYIDLCMSGCVQIDELLGNTEHQYTKEFVESTHKWLNLDHWVNDRIYDRRPFIYVPQASVIDFALNNFAIEQ